MRQLNKVDFADLPLDNAIKIVRGNGSRKVAMFADPNCGYCKRFERDLIGVSDITVYLFLYPILAPDSMQQVEGDLVRARPRQGVARPHGARHVGAGGHAPAPRRSTRTSQFGKSKRIQGTPTIFFEDGERVPGAMPIADFEKKLASREDAAPAKVSAK